VLAVLFGHVDELVAFAGAGQSAFDNGLGRADKSEDSAVGGGAGVTVENRDAGDSSDSSDEKDGLSPGAIAAIAVGSAAVVGAAAAGIYFLCVCSPKKQQKGDGVTNLEDYNEEPAEGELPVPGAPLPAEGVPTVVEGEKFEPKFDSDEDDDGSTGDDESEEDKNDAGAIL